MKKLLLLLTCLLFVNYANATISVTGDIDPADPSTWTSSDNTYVGDTSDGTLSVSAGDDILSQNTYIGNDNGVSGSVTITDTGSTWTNTNIFSGYYGTGLLNITNGGVVDSQRGYLGFLTVSNGTATISGTDSAWNINDYMYIGQDGTGTLTIQNGGTVNAKGSLIGNGISSNGQVTVTGTNSLWANTDFIEIGEIGQGTLTVSNGATVTNSGFATLGYGGAAVGTATVTGAGSSWTNNAQLNIGYNGQGTLNIEDGGQVSNTTAYIGYESGSTGTATVTDANSQWTNSSTLSVGVYGNGTLNIENGGSVSSNNGSIGDETGSTGIATVTGTGSTWTNTNDLIVGESGTGTLNVENGGAVTSDVGFVGYSEDTNGVAVVTGTGSSWTISDYLTIGDNGNGTLTISDGGTVTNTFQGYIGSSDSATGTVDVNNGTWTNYSALYVGNNGTGTLTIQNGGTVNNSTGYIGYENTSTGTVTVDNSTWTNGGAMSVGQYGTGTMTVQNGGSVSNTYGYIGNRTGSTGTVTVTGTGSTWTNANTLYVGSSGDGTLTISNGGAVSNANAYIAYGNNVTGIATVTGTGSTWTNATPLYVGNSGNGTLNITNGGTVSDTIGYIGYNTGSTGTAIVSGTDSTWDNSSDLFIGLNGTGSLNISNGGEVIADNAAINSSSTLSGNGTLSLYNGFGTLTNNGTIAPGNSIGTLTVDGSVVFEDGSTLEAEIDNSGNCDKLDVTGDVTINTGTTLAVNSNGETIENGKSYTLIEADGSITGEFTTLNTSLVTWDTSVEGSVSYNTSSVVLTASVNNFDDLSIFFTDNQIELGRTIQRIVDDGGSIGGLTSSIQGIVGDSNLRTAYNQLSGQTRSSIAPITNAGVSQFTNIVSGRMMNTKVASLGTEAPMVAMADNNFNSYSMLNGSQDAQDTYYGFWTKGLAAVGNRDAESGVNGYNYRIGGVAFGFDHQFTENFIGGFTLGYSNTNVEYLDSYDNSQIKSLYTGFYGSYVNDEGYLDGIFTYNSFGNETKRYVNFLSEKLEGDFDGYEFSGYLETAKNYNANGLLVQPLVGFGIGYQRLESYTEQGGSSALHFDTQSYESYKSSLGARISKVFKQENESMLSGQFRAKWNHEFGDTESGITANFASTPGYNFSIKDAEMSRDSAVLGVGLAYDFNKNAKLLVDYDTIINEDSTSQLVGLSLKIMW